MSVGLSLMKNVLTPLAKKVLVPLGLMAAASAKDAAVQKKIFELEHPLNLALRTTTLVFSNEDMNDVMKIVKSLEKSGLLIKGVSQTVENEAKEQKGGFLGMSLGILGASLL